jgi:hypothetical protein
MMKARQKRAVSVGAALLVGVSSLVAASSACGSLDGGSDECLDYACLSVATLRGSVAVAKPPASVEVRYCGKRGCVDDTLELAPPGETACTSGNSGRFEDGVCLTLQQTGMLQIEATLTSHDDGSVPSDGEEYSLEIVDGASGETLVEQSRDAYYEVTRRDNCHVCWKAEMAL